MLVGHRVVVGNRSQILIQWGVSALTELGPFFETVAPLSLIPHVRALGAYQFQVRVL